MSTTDNKSWYTACYPTLTAAECLAAGSEMEKFRHLIAPHCFKDGKPSPVLEIASGGVCCVPWAISFDLPKDRYAYYNSNHEPRGPIHVRGDCFKLPFEDECFWLVSASHILEDFPRDEWPSLAKEWLRVLAPGGVLAICVPDHDRWWEYVRKGGVHNHAHAQPQPKEGDLTELGRSLGLTVLRDSLTNCYDGDYSILALLAKRPS